MHSRHADLHQALAVLAPPRRFELLLLLLSGPDRSVSQLAGAVRLSQSCTTRHLQALERAGLVKRVRDGKRVVFRPAPRDPVAAGVLASLAEPGGRFAGRAPEGTRRAATMAVARARPATRPAPARSAGSPARRPPARARAPIRPPGPAAPNGRSPGRSIVATNGRGSAAPGGIPAAGSAPASVRAPNAEPVAAPAVEAATASVAATWVGSIAPSSGLLPSAAVASSTAPAAVLESPTPRSASESGNNSAPTSAAPRSWQELEDYLL